MNQEDKEQIDWANRNLDLTKKTFRKWKQSKPKELDQKFHSTHEQEFKKMDCLTCANCCKTTSPIFRDADIRRISKHLRMKESQFISNYLKMDDESDYVLQKSPCHFLGADNKCDIYDVRPLACREYPHTDRKKYASDFRFDCAEHIDLSGCFQNSTKDFMIAFHPNYVHPLPENHRFPMEKYDLLPKQLLHEGTVQESDFFEPTSLTEENLLEVHCPIYWNRLLNLELSDREQRVTGFKHSKELIEREITIMEGTRMAAQLALTTKIGFNIAGGTHHAFYDRGEGFCLLNDQVIAAKWLLNHSNIKKILIVDLDVHQGNGTASLLENEERIFTFSMHGESNYPMQKEKSDLDVPLKDGNSNKEYLYLLEKSLDLILSQFNPDFMFYQCGVDILETDKLGKLGITTEGCANRDRIVFQTASQLNTPIVCTMGGGYSPQIKHIVEAHANTFRIGFDIII